MSATEGPVAGEDGADLAAGEGLQRIEQVATRTGLTKRTLRYYEEIGLLEPPTRTEGGYRLYTETDIQRLELIKRLKDLLGFSLAEIKDMVQAEIGREQVRSAWQRDTDPRARLARLDEAEVLVRHQLRLVDEKLVGLRDMGEALRARLAHYDELRAQLRAQVDEGAG